MGQMRYVLIVLQMIVDQRKVHLSINTYIHLFAPKEAPKSTYL